METNENKKELLLNGSGVPDPTAFKAISHVMEDGSTATVPKNGPRCPYCNAVINREIERCPICNKPIRASVEEDNRMHKLLYTIFDICELAGFNLEGRINLYDKKTGRHWK